MQKWARGWDARRRTTPHLGGRNRLQSMKLAALRNQQDVNDYIDFHKFMDDAVVKRLQMQGGENESISEEIIGGSNSHPDIQT